MTENIYALCHGPADNPTLFYVGKTVGTVEDRFANHLRAMRDPLNRKEAYEYARHVGIDQVRVVQLGTTDDGSEADFVRWATEAGARLYNSNLGNTKVAKRPQRDNTWATVNREAEQRLDAVARRQHLHGSTQQLSKSQIVQQRLLNSVPTVDELLDAEWHATPVEMLGMKLAKSASRAEVLRWGDYRLLLAYRDRGKVVDAEIAGFVQNTRTREELGFSGWHMKNQLPELRKRRKLELLLNAWPDETYWLKPSSL